LLSSLILKTLRKQAGVGHYFTADGWTANADTFYFDDVKWLPNSLPASPPVALK
jgi:hypothetical protein